ncbi:hypothetical protein BKA66DRAFT_54382 [Pyrenochaeta sp. MPI-SDFR-AT-0127]|nr:hypothetical protein BKA66DRAFT_54382 [Pyrenochaeta sp. MPI-SDFR-AT-0127]
MAQPTVSIFIPPFIDVETPPSVLCRELEDQRTFDTPSSPNSKYQNSPPTTVSDKETWNRARFFAAHTGVLLDEHMDVVVGGVGSQHQQTSLKLIMKSNNGNVLSPARQSLTILPRPSTYIFLERYGPRSFIQAFVRGISCTFNCEMEVTSWALKVRYYEIAPTGPETEQQQAVRQANAQAYRDAILTLQTKWTDTYDEALRNAAYAVSRTTGMSKVTEERKRDFFRMRKDQPPQPEHDTALMTNRAQVEAAEKPPFTSLDANARLVVWRERMTRDVFASVLQDSRNMVDIRRCTYPCCRCFVGRLQRRRIP